jgi:hypothetical protein
MSDIHSDPNFPRRTMRENASSVWIGVAALALLIVFFVVIGMYPAGERQTAMNGPSAETTGSASPIPPMPPSENRQ